MINIQSIPVLCYHQISPFHKILPNVFESHLSLIRSLGFRTLSLTDLYYLIVRKKKSVPASVLITFDDCTLDNWLYAVPLLKKWGMKGSFFAITDFIGSGEVRSSEAVSQGHLSLDATPAALTRAIRLRDFSGFMNEAELASTVHDFGMEVYSHTASHQYCFISSIPTGTLKTSTHWSAPLLSESSSPDTPTYPLGSAYAYEGHGKAWDGCDLSERIGTPEKRSEFCYQELIRSKNKLERILGQECPFLCWPWGEYDQISLEAAKRAGYKGTLTLERGYVGPGSDPMRICRIPVGNSKSTKWLERKLRIYKNRFTANIFRKNFRKR